MNIPNKLPTQKGDSLQVERLTNAINDILDYLQAKEDKSYKVASSVCCDSSFRLEGDTKEGTMFHVCNNCNKACDIKLTQKEVEASKGEFKPLKLKPEDIAGEYDYKVDIKNSLPIPKEEKCDCPRCNPPEHPDMECSCGEMIKDGYACSKCREINMGNRKMVTVDLTPPEHEEDWEKKLGSYLSDRGDKPILNDYIRDNFVSKEKIKKYCDSKIAIHGEIGSDYDLGIRITLDDLKTELGLGD